jgi:hypothetical protein
MKQFVNFQPKYRQRLRSWNSIWRRGNRIMNVLMQCKDIFVVDIDCADGNTIKVPLISEMRILRD